MIDIPDVRRIIRDWVLTIQADYDDLVIRLCDELELTREERAAARMAADQLQAQVDVLIGKVGQQWISVEDRLPEKSGEYDTFGHWGEFFYADYYAPTKQWGVQGVTHWREKTPAPEAHDEN